MTSFPIRCISSLLIVSASLSAQARVEKVLGLALEKNPNFVGLTVAPKADESEILISRNQYLISYNKKRRAPNWAAWKVEEKSLGHVARNDSFSTDTDLEEYFKSADPSHRAVAPSEYTGSCMDRGHQVPSADRSDSVDDNKETFLMSNIAPQTAYLNRVIWAHLEIYTRNMIRSQHKKVFIVTGPIYDEDLGNFGPDRDIPVPSKFFKVIFILNAGDSWKSINKKTPSIAVIMPNVNRDGSKPNLSRCKEFISKDEDMNDWKKYQVHLADVESKSGLEIQELAKAN